MVTIERMIVFTILVLVSLAWINPVRVETKTSIDSQGVVSSTTTITVDYEEGAPAPTPSAAP
jgi:hypothetical protein